MSAGRQGGVGLRVYGTGVPYFGKLPQRVDRDDGSEGLGIGDLECRA